jgi:hypothetical protein
MPNDHLSLWPSPRRSARLEEGARELFDRTLSVALAVLVCMTVPACGGDDESGVTYDDDVEAVFYRRCTTCHRPVSPINVDIQNPFSSERGLVNTANSWAVEYPTEGLDARNVVPGDPDASFLMDKITGNLPANGHGGAAMPLQVEPITPDELDKLETWITNGAQNDQYFADNVRPIFGSEESDGLFFSGKCVFCHYPGSPNPQLDLTDPFGPNGLVNVDATYRGDIKRVQPNEPEESLLILKVRAQSADGDIGAQMPYSFDKLTASQVETVRQWIVEGAKP